MPGCLYGVFPSGARGGGAVYVEVVISGDLGRASEALCCDVFLENGRVQRCPTAVGPEVCILCDTAAL